VLSVWVEALESRFRHALDLLAAAVSDCTDALWEASMWDVPDDGFGDVRGPDLSVVTDAERRHALLQRHSAPWAVAWHALERLDFLLTGGFVPWEVWPVLAERIAAGAAAAESPGPGVTGHTGLEITTLSVPWSRDEVLAYLGYCRSRVGGALAITTDARAATMVGSKTYAARLLQAQDHVVEHAAQIRQFITPAASAT